MQTEKLVKILIGFCLSGAMWTVSAADIYVSAFAGDIQAAIDSAESGDTVLIEDGVYAISNELTVAADITVRGINGPNAVVIQGNGTTRCFWLSDTECVLRDLTVTGGRVDSGAEGGAGICCEGGGTLPVISNCVIHANTVTDDSGLSGGGIFGGTVQDCTITANSAPEGGGAAGSYIEHSRIDGNRALYTGGGAVYSEIYRSRVLNNSVLEGDGGGIFESAAIYCAISGNRAREGGGGSAYGMLNNCTVTRNTAKIGGGSYYDNDILNTIVWHNRITGESEHGPMPEGAGTLFLPPDPPVYQQGTDIYSFDAYIDFSCSPGLDTFDTGNITDDPLLASYSHLTPDSPCIGAGNDFDFGGPDIDGEPPASPPSMGCDEYLGPGTVTGPLENSIVGPALIAVNYQAPYLFEVNGPATLSVAEIEGHGVITNPVTTVDLSWGTPGVYDLVLKAWNDSHPGPVCITQSVTVVAIENATIHVSDEHGNDGNDGSDWAHAKKTIQSGIDAQIIPGGWILVSNGVYNSESFPIRIETTPVILTSLNGAQSTVIDAGFSGTCIQIFDPQSSVVGFTVTGGYNESEYSGGGIYCAAKSIFVRNCTVTGNFSYEAGGMYNGTAVNCLFTRNYSETGGAFTRGNAGNSAFAYNHTDYDGTLSYCNAWNCTITANSSDDYAGGAFFCNLYNCIIWHNTSQDGMNIDGCEAEFCCSPDLTHGDSGNITNNPQLASCSHLTASSPCIGAGDDAYAFEFDIDSQPWNSPPAMGCDEYSGPGTVTGGITLEITGVSTVVAGFHTDFTFIAHGAVTHTQADFDDSTLVANPIAPVRHAWTAPGVRKLIFTAWNDTYTEGVSVTQEVAVLSKEASAIYVDGTGGSDGNSGASWSDAKQTIQAGVNAQTVVGGYIIVSNNTYLLGTYITIDSPIQLTSLAGPHATIIDGGESSLCIRITDINAIVSGFTVTNGFGGTYGYGGGINCASDLPVISNCIVTACQAFSGGGVYSGTLRNCTITGNTASYGGGTRSSTAYDCLITGNTASQSGGGCEDGHLHRCIISGNQAPYGGGLYSAFAKDSLIKGNSATLRGGGCYYGMSYGCTIVDNQCATSGGGVGFHYAYNSIIYYNTAGGSPQDVYFGDVFSSCASNADEEPYGNITSAPQFADRPAGDYRLLISSPCINAGNSVYATTATDLDRNPRISGAAVDIGAYEYPITFPLPSVDKSTIIVNIAEGFSPPDSFFDIFNGGTDSFTYTISNDVPWLICSPSAGDCSMERDTITIDFDTAALPSGGYSGRIFIEAPGEIGSPYHIDVNLDVYVPEFDHFIFETIPGPQSIDIPFDVTVLAVDENGYPSGDYNGFMDLFAYKTGTSVSNLFVGDGDFEIEYPMFTYFHDSRSQVIYPRKDFDLGGPGQIISLALDVTGVPQQPLNNWTIRIRHTNLTDYNMTENQQWQTDWTVVYQQNTTITSNGWNVFTFDTPFEYNGIDNLMIDFSHNNDYWTEPSGTCSATYMGSLQMLLYESDSGDGDPLAWADSTPRGWAHDFIPNLMLGTRQSESAPITPNSIEMINGVWSGTVGISTGGVFRVIASAVAGDGSASSNPFTVSQGVADSDFDGVSDADEAIAGTNPNDPESYFHINAVTPGATGMEITWDVVPGRIYSIYWTEDLDQPFTILYYDIPPTGSFIDIYHGAGHPTGFYMLTVELAP